MKLIAIVPCRSEGWIAGLTFRGLLMWVDELVVLDHASDPPISASNFWDRADRNRVTILVESNPEWDEMRDRQRLLDQARARGATRIVTIDADELVTGNLLPDIRPGVECMPAHTLLQLPWVQLRGDLHTMHRAGAGLWGQNWATSAFVDQPEAHWQAAGGGYQHHHREPYGVPYAPYRPVPWGRGGLFHFQMMSERRLREKQFWYTLVERKRWPGRKTAEQIRQQYSPTVYGFCPPSIPAVPLYPQHLLDPVPETWWEPYKPWLKYLDVGAETWYVRECQKMLAADPRLADGLDHFGV